MSWLTTIDLDNGKTERIRVDCRDCAYWRLTDINGLDNPHCVLMSSACATDIFNHKYPPRRFRLKGMEV